MRQRAANGLLNGTDFYYLGRNIRSVPLTDDLFANDSFCMVNLRSQTLAIVEKDTGRAVRCDIAGFPYVLIWSAKPSRCGLSVLSPGTACPARNAARLTGDQRPCAAALAPGESWATTLNTTFDR